MLIHFTTSIKTTLLLLLFTIGGLNLYAGTSSTCLHQNDTITAVENLQHHNQMYFLFLENARERNQSVSR